ncbi:DUF4381 domain-containing protein [Shewanella schlegeliana]|uniref:DUF4381 domain-containing protein n=1 Tax=Shewanella schlegeliana TaxID=190308 RepID=A0ABS1SX89_9GAMM|nr:DUF4381 domain-containing protein [Shewanella schlegeliana]MBL4913168.1 DUF4381 domain-containing protein [Shewanella schlegeliana]MCL1109124.1 DUF4381 domain-containing protein [Shewanella schlegeliana]GIU38188.1 membrane protein [Shewanella schlegeliana]
MSNSVNPALATMQDIQTPAEIGLWPLAYGYWISLFVAIAVITLLIIWLRKHRKAGAVKRAALKELAMLDQNHQQFAVEVSSLLKRAAISYGSREQVAQLTGSDWYKWLNAQVKAPQDELCKLLALRFQKAQLTEDEKQALRLHAQSWLKAALPLRKVDQMSKKTSEVSQC